MAAQADDRAARFGDVAETPETRPSGRRGRTSRPQGHVLLVEDSLSLARVYQELIRRDGLSVSHVETGAEALEAIHRETPAVVLLDLHLPDMNGMEVLRAIHAGQLPCAVIVVTAHGSLKLAVEAMRHGAIDFLTKPFDAERLVVTLRNVLENRRLAALVDSYRETYDRSGFGGMLGSSLKMQAVYRIIESAAPSRATIFITGESGTGKELCAQAIHNMSPRGDGPFVPLNCGAIPGDLMESEIFGHRRGAFTGAVSDRAGAAERADGGTLFLDEICELPLELQTKLLRFIQSGTYTPVGGAEEQRTDIRFVCATNRDPAAEVRAGRFREDLYYRLHVVPVEMPPLRCRDEDIGMLAAHFLQRFAAEENRGFRRLDRQALAALAEYDWPGNVRQLQNVIRNAVVLHEGDVLTAGMLPALPTEPAPVRATPTALEATPASPRAGTDAATAIRPLWQVEKDAIEQAMSLCEDNIAKAAALLEINPSTIYRKRQRWQDDGLV
ncbi:sigma-54-dependent transcriptional regulator [Marinibaculum pumilum]|uniref:Sigma-54-dependent transcriptional regulator n=1 Tax=Marinibaculum pumilum TaxID=1766165 RepID=A0ABV7L3I5_9PROT